MSEVLLTQLCDLTSRWKRRRALIDDLRAAFLASTQLCDLTIRWTTHEDIPVSQQRECREIGRKLHALGGWPLMREAYYDAKGKNPAASVVAAYWDGIGEWQW